MVDDPTRATKVLLLTQGSYPFAGGGISTWCDLLCRGLPSTSFEVRAVTETVPAAAVVPMPANIQRLTQIGQQGRLDQPHWLAGFTAQELPPRRPADVVAVDRDLVPPLRRLFGLLALDEGAAPTADEAGAVFTDLWRVFQGLAWGECWRAEPVERAFAEEAAMLWSVGWHCGVVAPGPGRHDLATAGNWLRRYLAPLQSPLPAADLVHSSSAGPCVAVGIVAKRERATPLLLTEHGIGARERYLRRTPASPFVRRFVAALTRLWARAAYHHADFIATPTQFNRAWQIELGADPGRIEVVPNGVVIEEHGGGGGGADERRERLTVIAVAGVKPIKDLETLIRAAAIVARDLPNVRFLVHGTLDDRDYAEHCRRLIADLELGSVFTLCGFTLDRDAIYRGADVSVLSSVSEAHPFALLEAMARGVPVVATRVGGVPELVAGAGLLVPPRQPEALATALIDLLRDPRRRVELGTAGRALVEERYSLDRMIAAYDRLYSQLAAHPRGVAG